MVQEISLGLQVQLGLKKKKTIDFEIVLQAIEAKLACKTQGVLGDLGIQQSRVV